MYFFIFKTNGYVKHVIKAGTREDANTQLKALTGENPSWDHFGASVSVVHCEYNAQQGVNAYVMPCGHPLAEAYQGEDGGTYCRICESA